MNANSLKRLTARPVSLSIPLAVVVLASFLGVRVPLGAAETNSSDANVVRALLSDNCFACHGPDANAREADLRLDVHDSLFGQASSDLRIVEPGQPNASELIARIESDDEELVMPPPNSNLSLTPKQIALLRKWVRDGATWEQHWSFRPIVRPEVPVDTDGWSQNPIDRFVAQQLRKRRLSPAEPADKARWLRRVTFDLTGLPPSIEELDRFLADQRPGAEIRVVDRLLDSPDYGHRMAWDWLEVARYADSNGFQGDRERTMWPWRDWVIESFNSNQPYDEFTVWQLAGDLLPSSRETPTLATGFCRNHMINGEGGRIPAENRVEYIFDQIETVGTVWLGLTFQCCRCHDHKYDPLSQSEYYQLFAFFNQTPVDGSGGDPQTPPIQQYFSPQQKRELAKLDGLLASSIDNLTQLELSLRKRVEQDRESSAEINSNSASEMPTHVSSEVSEALAIPISKRDEKQLNLLKDHFKSISDNYVRAVNTYQSLRGDRDQLQRRAPRVMVMADVVDSKRRRETFILNKGLYNEPQDRVEAGTPKTLPPLADSGSRNRLDLAEWLVSPNQPLTARVTVNRFWQQFFGTGLVSTPNDFGIQGQPPSHPELLDWLAAEFIDSDWDVKHLLRLIVTSSTYRQSAKPRTLQLLIDDPNNRLLARGPRMRLSSWMLRDQALFTSGLLVKQTGGESVRPYQPPGVWEEATFGKKRYELDAGDRLYRRSLFTFWRRIVGPTMFFDVSKRQTCVVNNPRTNTPLHALVTLNDTTYVEAARKLAEQAMHHYASQRDRIALMFRRTTSRRPSEAELGVLNQRFEKLVETYRATPDQAKKLLAVGQSSNDSGLDQHEQAAHAVIALTLLNLDETLSK